MRAARLISLGPGRNQNTPRGRTEMSRKEDVAAIKAASPIEVVVGERIELKKEGSRYRGECPFHNDGTPSLVVNPEKGLWNCFGCPKTNGKTGGDVLDFLMRFERISFQEAASRLATRAGLSFPSRQNGRGNGNGEEPAPPAATPAATPSATRAPVDPARRRKLLSRVAAIYHKSYRETQVAQDYLVRIRGVGLESVAAKHEIGYAGGTALAATLPDEGAVVEDLVALGVVSAQGRERFTGRIVFPLRDDQGEVVGLVGRRIADGEPRHMALPEPFLGVFNRMCLKSEDWVILVEGVMDALSLEAAGYANAIPLFGKSVREELLTALRVAATRQVIVMLDGDAAEDAKTLRERLMKALPGVEVLLVNLPSQMDPNDFSRAHPPEAMRALVEGARRKPGTEVAGKGAAAGGPAGPEGALLDLPGEDGWTIRFESREYVIRGIEKRGLSLRVNLRAASGTRFFVQTVNLHNPREKRAFAKEAAGLFRVEFPRVERDVERIADRIAAFLTKREETLKEKKTKPTQVSAAAREQGYALGMAPDVLAEVTKDARRLGIVGEEANAQAMYLLVTSRKMSDPLSILFVSGSGAGKSLVQDRMLSLCPPGELVKVSALTGKSLFYREEGLKGKVLAIREEEGASDASYAIRGLISDKELVIEATVKDPLTGRMTTMTNRVEGPCAVSITSASWKVDPETVTRFLVRSIDESPEQTTKILEEQRKAETIAGLLERREREKVVERHQAFQALLVPVEVVNPFAQLLTYPVHGIRARRGQPMYLALIRTVAFMNQMKKEKKRLSHLGEEIAYIEVDMEDIAAGNRLAHELLGGTVSDLSEVGRQLLEGIEKLVEAKERETKIPRHEIEFTRRDVREWTGKGDFQVKTYLEELVALEYVVPASGGGAGKRVIYRLDYRGEGERRDRFALGLVELDELEKRAREAGLVP